MNQNWYFRTRGKTWGPFCTQEIKNLAAAGLLQPHDLLWPEEGDSRLAIQAAAALDFLCLERVGVPVPDWLSDVQEGQGRQSMPGKNQPAPDWLADVGQWEALEYPPAKAPPGSVKPKEPVATTLHDSALETAIQVAPSVASASEASIPVARPVDFPRKESTSREKVSQEPPSEQAPAAPPAEKAIASEATEPRKTVIRLMGFDPQTGQILDPDRFKAWKNEQKNQSSEPCPPAKSIQEIFQDGRRVVEGWVDADHNRELIMSGDWNRMRQNADLQESLRPYRPYGPRMLDKLWHHLQFMVENRRRFYSAYPQKEESP